jgi:hypothetical protein
MEEFFTKVLNYSNKKCEKLFPLLIDFDLKHCIKTETFKNSSTGRNPRGEDIQFITPYNPKILLSICPSFPSFFG